MHSFDRVDIVDVDVRHWIYVPVTDVDCPLWLIEPSDINLDDLLPEIDLVTSTTSPSTV